MLGRKGKCRRTRDQRGCTVICFGGKEKLNNPVPMRLAPNLLAALLTPSLATSLATVVHWT